MKLFDWLPIALIVAYGLLLVVVMVLLVSYTQDAGNCEELGGVDVYEYCIDQSVVIDAS